MYKSRFEDGGEIGDYYKTQTDTSISDGDDYNFPVGSGLFDTAGNINLENIGALTTDSELFKAFQAAFPEDAALLKDLMGGDYGFAPVGADNPTGQELVGPDPAASDISVNDAETKKLARQAGTDPNQDPSLKATGVPVGDPNDPMGTKKLGIDTTKTDTTKTDTTKKTGLEALPDSVKYLAMLAAAKLAYDDAERARQEARGWSAPGGVAKQMVRGPSGGVSYRKVGKAAGGIASLAGGGNVIGEKSAATPYQIYDKASDTYRYVDAAGYEKWLSGIPLTPTNRVQGSPVYYGAPSKAEGDYGIGGGSLDYVPSMSEEPDETLSLPRYDIYGNRLEDDPNLKTMTENETEEFEKHLAFDPEFRARLLEPLRNAFMSTNAVGDLDVQQTLRNIYNNPETRELFYAYTDQLKYAPYDAAEWFQKYNELVQRSEGEGFTPDREYMPLKGTELAQINRENRYLPRNIANEMFRLVAPNTPDTVIKNYGDVKGNLPEDYVVTDRGQAIEPNQGLNVNDLYYGMPLSEMGVTGGGGGKRGGVVHRPHYATGGMTTKQPFYLGGITDGMADEVPAHIDNKRPAALSDGEFVIPADVVSHLGNGNSNAGAKRLYEMMDNIREARTGNKNQGIQINPNKFMPR